MFEFARAASFYKKITHVQSQMRACAFTMQLSCVTMNALGAVRLSVSLRKEEVYNTPKNEIINHTIVILNWNDGMLFYSMKIRRYVSVYWSILDRQYQFFNSLLPPPPHRYLCKWPRLKYHASAASHRTNDESSSNQIRRLCPWRKPVLVVCRWQHGSRFCFFVCCFLWD